MESGIGFTAYLSTMTGVDILNTCTLKKSDMKSKILELLANAPVRTETCSLFRDFWLDKIRKHFSIDYCNW